MKLIVTLCLLLGALSAFAKPKVSVFVSLTPAGSFTAVSEKPKGNLFKQGDSFTADKISVTIESLKTGIDLRDEHFWKHLNSSKHDKAVLTNLKASGGKATADLEVNGVKKPINISYKVAGEEVVANFAVKASQFGLKKAEYLGVGVEDDVKVEAVLPFRAK
ncbi:MAG: YceI family protein [Bacteriovoracaceae bacterium]